MWVNCQEMPCLAVNDLAPSTFGATAKEKGQLWYQASNPIVSSQRLRYSLQSGEVQAQQAWKQNELPAGQGCLGGAAPGSAAGPGQHWALPHGKPRAQLVWSPRVGEECSIQG